MRAALGSLAIVVAAVATLGSVACESRVPSADVCVEAAHRFQSCGASMALLSSGPCSGARKLVARCVVDNADDCDALAGLHRQLDACVADLETDEAYEPPFDDTAGARKDGGVRGGDIDPRTPVPHDGGVSPGDASVPDAAPPPPAVPDSGPPPWTGLDATGSLARGEERRFATPVLPPGTYGFAITGTGDADLYVRRDAAPTTLAYHCRPFRSGSDESCAVTLTTPGEVHVMVRGGFATTSTFTLTGRP